MKTIDLAKDFLKLVKKKSPSGEDIDEMISIQKFAITVEPTTKAEIGAIIAVLSFDLQRLIEQKGFAACLRTAVQDDEIMKSKPRKRKR